MTAAELYFVEHLGLMFIFVLVCLLGVAGVVLSFLPDHKAPPPAGEERIKKAIADKKKVNWMAH